VRSAELLGEGDRLGVVHVDTEARWTVPLGPANAPDIAARVRKVTTGGGGIYVDLSLIEAYRALSGEKSNLKHVILFADGGDAEERAQAPGLVRDALRKGVTTSVVSLGRGSDVADLERLSEAGQGRFYLIEDASRLPAVFAQETIAATRSAIQEVAFIPSARSGDPVLNGLDLSAVPPLAGYVVTIPKSRSSLALEGPEGDPVLATWTVGVGRAAAFTSDYKGRWGASWLSWPGASQLFAQLARATARRADDPRLRFERRRTTASSGCARRRWTTRGVSTASGCSTRE
jgi:hypothetical protein